MEASQILSHTKQFLLKAISQTSPTALSSSQLRQVNLHTPVSRASTEGIQANSSFLSSFSLWSLYWWVYWDSWSPSVQTWTQRWLQLCLCISILTAWARRWISSKRLFLGWENWLKGAATLIKLQNVLHSHKMWTCLLHSDTNWLYSGYCIFSNVSNVTSNTNMLEWSSNGTSLFRFYQ